MKKIGELAADTRGQGKDRSRRTEVRGQRAEGGEIRSQRSEVRGREKTEVRGREKTEVGGQRTEDRGRRAEVDKKTTGSHLKY